MSWLEVATTLMDQKPRFTNDEELVSFVARIKYNYSKDYIRKVLLDIKEHRIITS